MVTYGLLDVKSGAVLCIVKLYRVLVLWLVLYLLDKVYQADYIEQVYVQHKAAPSLMHLPFLMVAIESAAFFLAFVVLLVFERHFKTDLNTFIVDETLLMQVFVDYALTTVAMLVIGIVVVMTITNCSNLRYSHDGLRGIRCATRITFYACCVVLAVPCFLVF